jgi:hypothetical protein
LDTAVAEPRPLFRTFGNMESRREASELVDLHPAIDQPVFRSLIGSLGHEMLLGVVSDFVRNAYEWLQKITDGLSAADAEDIAFAVHGLLSSSTAIGAMELARLTNMPKPHLPPADYLDAVVNLLVTGGSEIERFHMDALLLIDADRVSRLPP